MNEKNLKPKISIILPTFNVGEFIDRCLDSCVRQVFEDIEIIIIDDCGVDDSIARARIWAQKDNRIKILSNIKNLGTYHSRRLGVENATGEYILFLDPDDALERETTLGIFNATNNKKFDIVFFGRKVIPQNSNKKQEENINPPRLNGKIFDNFLKESPKDLGTSGKVYRKKVLISAFDKNEVPEGVRLVYGEDALIFYGALCHSLTSVSIFEPYYRYHINEKSITNQKSIADIKFQQNQIDLIISYIEEKKIDAASPNAVNLEKIKKYFKKSLLIDRHMLGRNVPDEYGNDQYFSSIVKLILLQKSAKSFIRFAAYICSFGKIRV